MNQTIFSLEKPYVQSYSDDSLIIDNREFYFPIILTTRKVIIDTLPRKIEEFYPNNISKLLEMNPELILIGTGKNHRIMDAHINQNDIGIEIMATGPACRIYNVMIEESRNVLAALYWNDGFTVIFGSKFLADTKEGLLTYHFALSQNKAYFWSLRLTPWDQ